MKAEQITAEVVRTTTRRRKEVAYRIETSEHSEYEKARTELILEKFARYSEEELKEGVVEGGLFFSPALGAKAYEEFLVDTNGLGDPKPKTAAGVLKKLAKSANYEEKNPITQATIVIEESTN